MFKCIDNVVGEIIESENKMAFLEEVNRRFTDYNNMIKSNYQPVRVGYYFINGVYYLVER